MSDVSVIIRCYNEEAHIGRLLSGIVQQDVNDLEIIVVDSGSTDATLSIASQFPTRIIDIDKEEFSFGRSLNHGCEAARGEILVFASAHVYPLYHDWISRMLEPFADERVACVYGKHRGNSLTKFSEHQVFARWFPEESVANQDHPFCNNANAAVRRSIWEKFRYDETLTGLEDLAWAKQIIAAGYRISYQADAVVAHVHEETYRQILNRYRREAIAMKAIFPHERFSLLHFFGMFAKNAWSDARRAANENALWRNLRSILRFRLMQFWGTYRGYAQHGAVSRVLRQKFYYPNDVAAAGNSSRNDAPVGKRIDYSKHDAAGEHE